MSKQRSLRLLVKVRVRRVNALEEAVKNAMGAHQKAIEVEDEARNAVSTAIDEERAGVEKLQEVTSAGHRFDINEFLYREDHAKSLKGNVETCQSTLESKMQATVARKQEIRERRLVVTRHEQKTTSLKNQISQMQAEAQLNADDAQDEEAEESSISRFILAAKAQSTRGANE
jgi:Bacterial type III secretion protein (HrpB7)